MVHTVCRKGWRSINKAVHTQHKAHTRGPLVSAGVVLVHRAAHFRAEQSDPSMGRIESRCTMCVGSVGCAQTRRCINKAVHTQGKADTRQCVATAGFWLFKAGVEVGVRVEWSKPSNEWTVWPCTPNAVHTQGGAHTRPCIHKAQHKQGVSLPPQKS